MNIKRNSTRILTGLAGILLAFTAICSVPAMRTEAATTNFYYAAIRDAQSNMVAVGNNGTKSYDSLCHSNNFVFNTNVLNENMYVRYPKAVWKYQKSGSTKTAIAEYDLYLYPWSIQTNSSDNRIYMPYKMDGAVTNRTPGLLAADDWLIGFRLKVYDPEAKQFIKWTGTFGAADIDSNEYFAIKKNISYVTQAGKNYTYNNKNYTIASNLSTASHSDSKIPIANYYSTYNIYRGTADSNTTEAKYITNAIFGTITIPAEGADFLYGSSNGGRGSILNLSDMFEALGEDIIPNVYDIPTAKTGLTYNGSTQTGVPTGDGYNITGNTATAPGNYTATATLKDSKDCWSDGTNTSKQISWSIANATIVSSTSNKTATYTGSPIAANSVSVTTPSSGYTVKYGTSSGSYTLSSPPTRTDAGTTTVYYQITASGYTTKTGSYSLTVTKATGSITASNQSTDYPNTKQISYLRIGDGTVSVTSSDTSVATVAISNEVITATPKKPGTTTITISAAQGTNHTAASKSIAFAVNPGTITATASNQSANYTGSPITAPNGVTVSSPTGCTVTYSTASSGTFSSDRPSWTNAGTYTVYYKVTKTYYTTVTGSYTFTINRAAISVPTKNTGLIYNGSTQVGVDSGTGYIRSGSYSGVNAGDYTATVTPDSNHKWTDNTTTGKSIVWSIARKKISVPTGNEFTYDGTSKSALP